MENPDLVLQETGNSQGSTDSRLAECFSRQAVLARPDHSEWSLLPEAIQIIYNRWHQPQMDLFEKRFRLPQFVSLVQDSLAWPVEGLGLPWEDLTPMPVSIVEAVKLRDYP